MKSNWIHGSAVDKNTRTVRYLSASALQLADMSTDKGCLRKWYYAYVEGKKEPSTKAQDDGARDHEVIEKYLETGNRVFSPRAAKGIHMLPPPIKGLQVEHDLIPTLFDAEGKPVSGLHLAPLRAAGIPIVGRIDLMHSLGINFGADNVEDTHDPEGTVEVFDHKFVKSLDYALSGPDLIKNIQMVAYGEYVFRTVDGVKFVRLSHGYYPSNGNAKKSTIRTTREPISRYWTEHVEPLARSMADAAKKPTADQVTPNPSACKAFNRLCIHAEYCDAGMKVGLAAKVGQTAAKALLDVLTNPKANNMPISGKSLLSHISKAPQQDDSARQAELAKLKDEEKKILVPEGFGDLLATIDAYDKGRPQIGGNAAKVYAAHMGYEHKHNAGYGGSGELGEFVTITEVEQFEDLVKELRENFGEPEIVTQSVAEVPAVNPDTVGLVPDDAPGAVASPPAQTTPLADIAAAADKPKKTRSKKKDEPAVVPISTMKADELPVVSSTPTLDAQYQKQIENQPDRLPYKDAESAVNLLVDVVTEGGTYVDLAPQIDAMAAAIAQRFGLDDCRTGGQDSPVGYGKWKGVLAAMVRAHQWAGGNYRIDTRGNEIYEEAVQAMRSVVRVSGGTYTRGAR